MLAMDVVSSDVLKITPYARPKCRHSALRTNQIVIFFMTSCVLLDADFTISDVEYVTSLGPLCLNQSNDAIWLMIIASFLAYL